MSGLRSVVRACRRGASVQAAVEKFVLEQQRRGPRRIVTLIPGDGTGPEATTAVLSVFKALNVPVDFEEVQLCSTSPNVDDSLKQAITSIKRNGVALKGITKTPLGHGTRTSVNVQMRRELGLFADVINCKSIPGLPSRHKNVDIVVIRQNTEGEYSLEEHEVLPGIIESLKVTTREKSLQIAKFAFDYAVSNGRSKVTCVHKANIMKRGDGLFLESCKEVAAQYPKIAFQPMIVDNTSMQLVSKPSQFDVMVTPNLYGSIVASIGAGLVGGPGVVPGQNFGVNYAVFEPGARQIDQSIAGSNRCNPTAMLLASVKMLEYLQLPAHASTIQQAVFSVIQSGTKTLDLGGTATTTQFTTAVISEAGRILSQAQ
eukprot:m.879023 g.879023  ORF g.879023 m.879023 type:complete len:372 (+) comp59840_c0_seq3:545-1660(+)